ncbi:30807_t:CDS:2, partial [Gigaspora margarita]
NHELLSIPYNEFKNIKVIDKGRFLMVYSAEWFQGNFIKTNYDEFINKFKAYSKIEYENPSFLKCYRIIQQPDLKEYIFHEFNH